jgi:D-glycero-D-manno-heptose 1,7-bisphosphate phosphatase
VKRKAIFFDRDGVLNKSLIKKSKPYAPKKISEFKIYKNLRNYILKLKDKSFLIYVVTNQPDFFEKKKRALILKMHHKLKNEIPIDRIFCCFDVKDTSIFKKPNTGLVKKMIKKKNIDLSKSYVIGDRWRDIDFAHNLKCKSIFINRKYDEKLNKKPNYVCKSTAEAIITVLKNE